VRIAATDRSIIENREGSALKDQGLGGREDDPSGRYDDVRDAGRRVRRSQV
jgi:hypothetical protein